MAVKMKIDKFGDKPVKIDENHPLAVAQREKNAAAHAAAPVAAKPSAAIVSEPTVADKAPAKKLATHRRKRK